MGRSTRRIGITAAATAGTLAAGAALALAASPQAGVWTGTGEGGGMFTVKGGAIRPAGVEPNQAITAPSNFKCNTSNLQLKATRITISGGRFRFDGKAYVDKFRAPGELGHLVWTGTFKSASKVTGTYRFTSPVTPKFTPSGVKFVHRACDSGKQRWSGAAGYGGGGGGG